MRINHALYILAGSAAMTGATNAPLSGNWGGDRTTLSIGPAGGRLEQDCAAGSFGPVRVDSKGRFQARGRWTAFGGGPQRADVPDAGVKAKFTGQIAGTTLRLSIVPDGAAPQHLTLVSGSQVKMIRCL